MELKMHEYQKRAMREIIEKPATGLFLDMGLGKTIITLTAVAELIDRAEVGKVLVIAPLRVAETTWTTEAEKWNHTRHLRISRILGTAKERTEALKENADIYVINRENVPWLVDQVGKHWPFDMIVIDELSSFKSTKAKRFKALKQVRPMADRVVGLTGTPCGNSLMDLWAEVYLLDRGERLGRSFTAYQQKYFKPAYGSGHIVYKWQVLPGALKDVTRRLSDITVSMKAADHLNMPELIFSNVEVEMTALAPFTYIAPP